MPSECVRVKLGDLIRVKHGFAFKGEHFVDEPSSHVLVTPGNFAIGGGFQDTKLKFYRGPVPEEYILKPGDLVVTMTDLSRTADTLGFGAVVPQSAQWVYLHNQRIGLIELLQPSKVSKVWLHYLMRTSDYRTWVVGSATGSTVKHTSPSRICDFEFDLPPLAVQREAAATLDTLEGRISLLRQTNATLESIAQALFKSWFIDFDPVRAKAEGREPEGMEAATAALFPAEFEESALGLIPRGWGVVPFAETVNIMGGGTPKTSVAEFWGGDVPWFSVVDAPDFGQVFTLRTEKSITTAGVENSSTRVLPAWTTIISARGTVGKLAMTACPMAMNQSCYGLVPKLSGTEPLVYLAAQHLVDDLKRLAHGGVFDTITRDTLSSVDVANAPSDVRASFAAMVKPMFEQIQEGVARMSTLAELRDTLLPRLISGKLRLPEGRDQQLEGATV